MRTNTNVYVRNMPPWLKNQKIEGRIPPESNGRTEDSTRGVKLIWPQLNSFCSYIGIFPVQKIRIRYLSNKKIIGHFNHELL